MRLPRRVLPVAVLAWLGVSEGCQGQGLGRLLLAQALIQEGAELKDPAEFAKRLTRVLAKAF